MRTRYAVVYVDCRGDMEVKADAQTLADAIIAAGRLHGSDDGFVAILERRRCPLCLHWAPLHRATGCDCGN